jgi:hypothetical protein
MLRDFDYAPTRKWIMAFKDGTVVGRVPEAAVNAIIAAKAGEIAADGKAKYLLPDPKNRKRKCQPAG